MIDTKHAPKRTPPSVRELAQAVDQQSLAPEGLGKVLSLIDEVPSHEAKQAMAALGELPSSLKPAAMLHLLLQEVRAPELAFSKSLAKTLQRFSELGARLQDRLEELMEPDPPARFAVPAGVEVAFGGSSLVRTAGDVGQLRFHLFDASGEPKPIEEDGRVAAGFVVSRGRCHLAMEDPDRPYPGGGDASLVPIAEVDSSLLEACLKALTTDYESPVVSALVERQGRPFSFGLEGLLTRELERRRDRPHPEFVEALQGVVGELRTVPPVSAPSRS